MLFTKKGLLSLLILTLVLSMSSVALADAPLFTWVDVGRALSIGGYYEGLTVDQVILRGWRFYAPGDPKPANGQGLFLRPDMSSIVRQTAKDSILTNEEMQIDVAPRIINDTTYVPARVVLSILGASVNWDEATQTVTVTRGDTTIALTVGSDQAIVNGKATTMTAPVRKVDDRTLLPLRFISTTLGHNVGWDEEFEVITIRLS